MSILRNFKGAIFVSLLAVVAGFLYGGLVNGGAATFVLAAAFAALGTTFILGVLEFTFSMDNAVVNAKYVERLDDKWQRWFLTWGILIAVFGMRLLFPLAVVGLTSGLWPHEALKLAFEGGGVHDEGSYAFEMHQAHPAVAAFGGMFLLMIFLKFVFEDRDLKWLTWLETPLAKVGKLDQFEVIVSLITLAVVSKLSTGHETTVLFAGISGLALYLAVNALNEILEEKTEHDEETFGAAAAAMLVKQTGRAALMTVLFLEVLDASFSFDGVIGAFAITSDPVIILLGLGFIGSIWVRSLTVYLVRQGTLNDYEYLEHGAHWSIGVLAIILLATINHPVPEWVTGLVGLTFIVGAYLSSVRRNKRNAAAEAAGEPQSELVDA